LGKWKARLERGGKLKSFEKTELSSRKVLIFPQPMYPMVGNRHGVIINRNRLELIAVFV